MNQAEEKCIARQRQGSHQSKLNIAIISPGLFSVPPIIGTSVEHDIDMVSQALSKEHRVIVYTRKCKEFPHSTEQGNLVIRRIRYRGLKHYLEKVSQHLRKRNIDLIQVENRPQFIPYLRKKFPHTPLILNMHSMQFASRPWLSPKKARKSFKQINALLTNSHFLAQEYLRKFPCLEGKVYGVHLGIESEPYIQAARQTKKLSYWRKRLGLGNQEKVILFAGRLNRNKGAHHLLQALPKILKQKRHVKLLLVGSPRYGQAAPTAYVKKLRQRAKRWSKQITFTGFIKPKQMPYLYQLADVVVTPSVWKEPFCRVNLEAMSSAKPVVTTKRGGIPEVVEHKKNGYVLSLKQIDKTLPESILKLLEDEDERKKFGLAGLERAQNVFTWEKTVEGYLQVYQQILTCKSD